MSVSFRLLSVRLLLVIGFLSILAAVALSRAPETSAAARSVKVIVNNNGDLPLYRDSGDLDHGVWTNGVQPPGTIAPHSTVSWESESDGVLTGTEGWVKYLPEGAAPGNVAYFHWNNPYIGSNQFHSYGPDGCSVSHDDPGGNNTTVTFNFACSSTAGDGIADLWKLHGAYFNPTGDPNVAPEFIDLPAMGAKVNEKEIFVQIDWMANATITQKLDPAAIKKVVDAFAAVNIRLFVDQGPDSILDYATNSTWGTLSRAKSVTYQAQLGTTTPKASGGFDYNWTAFNTIRDVGPENFKSTGRWPIFHYVVAAHNIGSVTNSGLAPVGGSNVILSLGAFTGGVGSIDEQAGTFMHELGHNLGLDHGGGDATNNKPNYFSVMNYLFQMSGVIRNGSAGTFDYSHSVPLIANLPSLDEAHLNETAGLGPGANSYGTKHYCPKSGGFITVLDATAPIDWDCDGKANKGDVSFDVNNDGTTGGLVGYEDWAHIKFDGGSIGHAGAPNPPVIQTLTQEMTPEMLNTIKPVDTTPPVTTATSNHPANANGWNNTDVTITLAATDDISGVARTEYNLDNAGWTTYTTPITVSAEGKHTLQYRSVDLSQNQEADKSLAVWIDKTLPTITAPIDGQRYIVGTPIALACQDALSGVQSCQVTVSRMGSNTVVNGGQALPSSGPGYYTVAPTNVSDLAGNQFTTVLHYTVAYDVVPLSGYTDTVRANLWARIVIALKDNNGTNLSARSLGVSSLRLERLDAGNNVVQTADLVRPFQYSTFGRDPGYQLLFNTRNMTLGPWRLVFTTADAPDVEMAVQFNLIR